MLEFSKNVENHTVGFIFSPLPPPPKKKFKPMKKNLSRCLYEGHLERKERFAIKKYLFIIGKKKNVQVLSHTFTYFST